MRLCALLVRLRARAPGAAGTPDKCEVVDGTSDQAWKRKFPWSAKLGQLNLQYFGNRAFRWGHSQGKLAGVCSPAVSTSSWGVLTCRVNTQLGCADLPYQHPHSGGSVFITHGSVKADTHRSRDIT